MNPPRITSVSAAARFAFMSGCVPSSIAFTNAATSSAITLPERSDTHRCLGGGAYAGCDAPHMPIGSYGSTAG